MQELRQIFSRQFRGNFANALKLIFLPEGYLSSQEQAFYNDVEDIIFKLQDFYPISLTRAITSHVACYWKFMASNNHGPATTTTGISGRTLFESYYNATSQTLQLNQTKVDNTLDNLVFTEDVNTNNINLSVGNGGDYSRNTAVIIVLPSYGNNRVEAELTDPAHYSAVATSMDGRYEQVIVRFIGKLLSLGDEFEMAGASNLNPDADQIKAINGSFVNLIAYPASLTTGPNPYTDTHFPWRGYFNRNFNAALPLHPHPGAAGTADRTLPAHPLTYKKIELWEGGGTFRKQVYRTAYDCLMRRRIGDPTLPVKDTAVSLCPVCMAMMERYFG